MKIKIPEKCEDCCFELYGFRALNGRCNLFKTEIKRKLECDFKKFPQCRNKEKVEIEYE